MISIKYKKQIIVCILFFCYQTFFAQQQNRFTQFMFNEYAINPAYTGAINYSPVQLTYRKQWQGFNGSPETFTFGGHTAINSKMGIGGQIFKDDMGGAVTQTGIMLNYVYRVRINDKSGISFGIGAMINQVTFDNTKINALDANDPGFQGGVQKSITPDAMFGILYQYNKKLKIGIGSSQLIQSKLKNINTIPGFNSRLIRHYNAEISYKFIISEKISIEPSILAKATEVTPLQIDINTLAWYKSLIMVGFTYRHKDAVAILLGAKYKNMFLGYSYDISTTAIKSYNNGSHEIMLGYHFVNKIKNINTFF